MLRTKRETLARTAMRGGSAIVGALTCALLSLAGPAHGQDEGADENRPKEASIAVQELLREIQHDESPPLREIRPVPPGDTLRTVPPPLFAPDLLSSDVPEPDAVLQTAVASVLSTIPGLNLDGAQGGIPPDPNGAVGAFQYMHSVNFSFSVYSKATGVRVYGPAAGSTIFSEFGGPCATYDGGDARASVPPCRPTRPLPRARRACGCSWATFPTQSVP